MTHKEIRDEIRARLAVRCGVGASPLLVLDHALDELTAHMARMEERIAARDADIARLRREMNALRTGLQYGIESTDSPSDVGRYLAGEIVKAGDDAPSKARIEPHMCECGDCDQK